MTGRLTNWAGSVTFQADDVRRPDSLERLRRLVAGSGKVRALGSGHSFNDIADTTGDLVSLAGLPRALRDRHRRAGGHRRRRRAVRRAGPDGCDGQGYALHNLASLPHISVAGAGRHGDPRLGGRATATWPPRSPALELVTADGELVTLDRDRTTTSPARWSGSARSAWSPASRSTSCRPSTMRQDVYEDLPLRRPGRALRRDHRHARTASACSPSWRRPADRPGLAQAAGGRARRARTDWFAARPARRPAASRARRSPPENCTEQLGVPGPWHERLPHFRLGVHPEQRRGAAVRVPRAATARGRGAARAGRDPRPGRPGAADLRDPHHRRRRPVAEPAYRQDSVALHFTWVKDWTAVAAGAAADRGARSRRSTPGRTGASCSPRRPRSCGTATRGWPTSTTSCGATTPSGTFRNDFLEAPARARGCLEASPDGHLAQLGPVVLRDLHVHDPRRLGQVRREGPLRRLEVVGLDVRGTRVVVAERLDQDVLGRVVEAAGPVEPQASGLGAGRPGEVAAISGQRSASSGRTRNLAVMKIMTRSLGRSGGGSAGTRVTAESSCCLGSKHGISTAGTFGTEGVGADDGHHDLRRQRRLRQGGQHRRRRARGGRSTCASTPAST